MAIIINTAAVTLNKTSISIGLGNQPAPVTKTINVNLYGGTNPYSNSEWNDWNIGTAATPLGFTNLLYSDGSSSGFDIAWVITHQGVIDNTAGYGGGVFPAQTLRYGGYTTNSTFAGSVTSFNINNLNNSKTYNFEFVGSRNNTGNTSYYRAVGTTTVDSANLVTDSNKNNSVTISNITPSAGAITIKWARPAVGTFAYLNLFKITEI